MPPPATWLVVIYYAALLAAVVLRGRVRVAAAVVYVAAVVAIVSGADLTRGRGHGRHLTLTMFDVGQSESMLLEAGDYRLLVDTGGAPLGGGIDIGRRVLAPALWARGLRSLDAVLVTHPDPDHVGGAVAIATANRVYMLEHAIYTVASPEAAASILWRDSSRAVDAATNMKITAQDLLKLGVIDGIIPEPIGGAHRDGREVVEATADKIGETLAEFDAMAPEAIRKARREKFLGIGRLS